MQNSRAKLMPGNVRYRALMTISLLLLAATAPDAGAVEVTALYTAQVPYDASVADGREHAYLEALVSVLSRVSGSAIADDPFMVEQLFPDPAQYVLQFRRGADDTLWVSFDGRAIESTLRAAGQPIWGSERPLTLIWLAVDHGQGQREIVAADEETEKNGLERSIDRDSLLRERVLEAANRRGLPVVFPLMDTEDRALISFSDIWGGFDDALLDASKRYDVNSILVGRIRGASSQRNRWSYYFGGAQRSWTGTPETVVGQVADLLAAELAIGGDAALATVRLRIAGIDSVDAYGNVEKILSNLGLINSYRIVEVDNESIVYRVDAHGGADRLRRALSFNGLIEQRDDGFGSTTGALSHVQSGQNLLEFFYSP